jgi:aerobic carbon-monoxide dehydrogenase medium subunit
MKPAAFEIARPASLAEAAKLLAANEGAKAIAGGQSLGPMLNLRLAQPSLLIDITGIAELTRVEHAADHITLGACITTGDIEDRRIAAQGLPMLAQVAGRIAYRAVRNRGTIGGSLCHADPAGDWMTALAALGADAILTDGARQRTVPVARLMRGAFETAIGVAEILQAVRIPKPSACARWGYYKVCRKAGEFALAIGAVYSDPERGAFRAVMGATNSAPVVVEDAAAIFGGARRSDSTARFDEAAAARLLTEQGRDFAAARLRLHLTALARAAEEARAP